MRIRAAWMYYVEEMTQSEIAERLGIGRVTVVRLLSDARERNEVKLSIEGELSECVRLERLLEQAFGIGEAVVVPVSDDRDPAHSIGTATGDYLSALLKPDMTIGVGWGRTLYRALGSIGERPINDLKVISLLGGITKAREFNPSEFAWQFASLFRAESYLLTAPAFVDSPETRRALIERCGLKEVFDQAERMDVALISTSGMEPDTTTFKHGLVTAEERESLIRAGAVGDCLCTFFDATGQTMDHPVNRRVMAVPLETIARIPKRILASGGKGKVPALQAFLPAMKPTTFITDEVSAKAILKGAAKGKR
nr:sugar-binding transcriptional regulator [Chthonobacter albigriseus]